MEFIVLLYNFSGKKQKIRKAGNPSEKGGHGDAENTHPSVPSQEGNGSGAGATRPLLMPYSAKKILDSVYITVYNTFQESYEPISKAIESYFKRNC